MEIYKGLDFDIWCKKKKISDQVLIDAVLEMNQGLYDALLGGSVYKKRIPLQGRGKRGGARTILAFKKNNKAFYIYGFSKNQQKNISPKELAALKKLAKTYLNLSDDEISTSIKKGALIEVVNDG